MRKRSVVGLTVVALVNIFSVMATYFEVQYNLISKLIYSKDSMSGSRIELVEDGSYELVDGDYDGKIDESHKYDVLGNLVFSKLDSDYDGYLETKVFFGDGRSTRSLVDTDKNGIFDLVFLYETNSKQQAIKFIKANEVSSNIQIYEMDFGFPVKFEVNGNVATEEDFSKIYNR